MGALSPLPRRRAKFYDGKEVGIDDGFSCLNHWTPRLDRYSQRHQFTRSDGCPRSQADRRPNAQTEHVVSQAIGNLIPYALGIATSPIAIIAVILMVLSKRGRCQQFFIPRRLAIRCRRRQRRVARSLAESAQRPERVSIPHIVDP